VRFRPLNKPPLVVQPTTLWDYPSQHYGKTEQGSSQYRGATPSYIIWNVIQRFTRPTDLVVDPFCGSGTTIDVCKDTGRRSAGFDIAPFRPDIVRADARKLPLDKKTAHLVFFDPPYADNLAYSDDPSCIGKLKADDGSWAKAMDKVIDECRRVLRDDGVLAMFVCDVLQVGKGKKDPARRDFGRFAPLGLQLADMASSRGFILIDHVAVVRHSKGLEGGHVQRRADDVGFMLRGFSHLLLLQKTPEA
jgi:DNA modification methylase